MEYDLVLKNVSLSRAFEYAIDKLGEPEFHIYTENPNGTIDISIEYQFGLTYINGEEQTRKIKGIWNTNVLDDRLMIPVRWLRIKNWNLAIKSKR